MAFRAARFVQCTNDRVYVWKWKIIWQLWLALFKLNFLTKFIIGFEVGLGLHEPIVKSRNKITQILN